ncbi:hypothetical protein ACIRNI_31825, partial [Streptomyces sp. NPDC093546]|uniref:hypothetical protein n=1 Tax=Streptomyces sp. NPDC093546 TaxID=3366040 RepID=UPI003821C407
MRLDHSPRPAVPLRTGAAPPHGGSTLGPFAAGHHLAARRPSYGRPASAVRHRCAQPRVPGSRRRAPVVRPPRCFASG